MRLRKRAAALTLGAGVLFLLGTNVQAGWLYVMCALLLGTVVAGAILPGRMLRGIEVTRHAPEEVVQGDDVPVELIVSSKARGVRLGLRIDDPHVAPTSVYVTSVLPGERVELVTARLAAKRGVHQGSPVVVRSTAPFGVAERRRKLTVAGSTTVLPAVIPLSNLPFVSRASDVARAFPTDVAARWRPRVHGCARVPAGRQPEERSLALHRTHRDDHGPRAGGGALTAHRRARGHADGCRRRCHAARCVLHRSGFHRYAAPSTRVTRSVRSPRRLREARSRRPMRSIATSFRRRLAGLQPNGIALATAVEAAGTALIGRRRSHPDLPHMANQRRRRSRAGRGGARRRQAACGGDRRGGRPRGRSAGCRPSPRGGRRHGGRAGASRCRGLPVATRPAASRRSDARGGVDA